MQPAAVEVLTAVAPVLSKWGRWYLFGAQAVIAHGVPRLSADVDVTVALVPDTPDRFADDMAGAGFALRVNATGFVARTRVLPFVHRATAMPLDVVLAGSGLEDEFLGRAVSIRIGTTNVPVIELGDLIVAKLLAGRPKDLDDAARLWQIHGPTLDSTRITETLRQLEGALSQNDLIPAFEALRSPRVR